MPTDRQRAQSAERQQRFRQRQADARAAESKAKGLPKLPPIPTMPGYARWTALFLSAQAAVAVGTEEMNAYYEARSDAWREGERGQQFTERIQTAEDALSHLDELTQ